MTYVTYPEVKQYWKILGYIYLIHHYQTYIVGRSWQIIREVICNWLRKGKGKNPRLIKQMDNNESVKWLRAKSQTKVFHLPLSIKGSGFRQCLTVCWSHLILDLGHAYNVIGTIDNAMANEKKKQFHWLDVKTIFRTRYAEKIKV